MQATRYIFLAVMLMTGLPAPLLYADGLIRDGIGAISIGRGGTNLGFADNGTIIHDNPAAMTNISGSHLYEVGMDSVITDLHYEEPGVHSDGEFSVFPSGVASFVRRDPNSRLAYGVGIFAPAGFGARFRMDNDDFGRSLYKSIGALAKVLPGAAYEVNDRLSIGGTFGVAISHVELEGPFYTKDGTPNLIDLQCTGATPSWGVGMQYELTPATTLGVAYTSESEFDFEGNARTTVPGPLSSEFDLETGIVWPRSLGIGLQHRLCDCRRLGFDFYWYDWSDAFDQLDMKLTNASNPIFAAQTPLTDSLPMNWRDTYSFRFGYEWDAPAGRVWRTGYVYHRSPTPDSTLNPYLDGVLEHAVSVGYSRPTRYGVVNLAYQFTWGPTRDIGDSQLVGDDFDDSRFRAAAHWLSISLLR